MDPYSSHIPILEFIFKTRSISSVFEFGPGKYSTRFFEENAKHTISVELTNEEWFNKVKNGVDHDRVEVLYITDLNKALDVFAKGQNYDLVFVDGSFESRVPCIEAAFRRSPVIVTHDTEMSEFQNDPYRWNSVRLQQGYFWVDVMQFLPWTSVVTNQTRLMNELLLQYSNSRVK